MSELNKGPFNRLIAVTDMPALTVPTGKGEISFLAQHIIRIQGLSNYSKIFFADNRYPITVTKVLKRLQKELPEALFIRPHRTHLVNKNFVAHIRTRGGHSCLLLQNGETIAISRRNKTAMKKNTGIKLIKN